MYTQYIPSGAIETEPITWDPMTYTQKKWIGDTIGELPDVSILYTSYVGNIPIKNVKFLSDWVNSDGDPIDSSYIVTKPETLYATELD